MFNTDHRHQLRVGTLRFAAGRTGMFFIMPAHRGGYQALNHLLLSLRIWSRAYALGDTLICEGESKSEFNL